MKNKLFRALTIVGITIAAFFICGGVLGLYNLFAEEGVEVTYTGTVQLIRHDHDKIFNYDYTNIELLTYSGDTHHLELLGHVDLEFGKTYKITYVRTSRMGHHIILIGKVRNIEMLEIGE